MAVKSQSPKAVDHPPAKLTDPLTDLLAWLTGYRGIPYLARHTFRYEFLAVFTFVVAVAVMDGNFAMLFAVKTLQAPDWLLPVIQAGGAAGNLTAVLTSPLLLRRRQVPLMVLRMVICGVLLASVALLPPQRSGAYIFALIMLVIAMLNATATNARTTLWQSNYPEHLRGKIISRLTLVSLAMVMIVMKLQSWLLDAWPGGYRLLFLLAGVAGIVTAILYARIRIRGEAARLRRQSHQQIAVNPWAVIGVLRQDRIFARYMAWQMLLGSATLLAEWVLVLVLVDRFGAKYSDAATPLMIVPMLTQLFSLPVLGGLYDTMNIFIFRGMGAACWGLGRIVLFVASIMMSMPLVVASRVCTGLANSFGGLAWNLGHMNFTTPARAPLYMGAHLLMNGIRGITMPFLGLWLYKYTPVGIHLLWITGLLHMTAAFGLWRMRKTVLPAQ